LPKKESSGFSFDDSVDSLILLENVVPFAMIFKSGVLFSTSRWCPHQRARVRRVRSLL